MTALFPWERKTPLFWAPVSLSHSTIYTIIPPVPWPHSQFPPTRVYSFKEFHGFTSHIFRITLRFWQHGQNLGPVPPATTDTKSRSYSLLQNSSASDHTPLPRHVIVGDIPGTLAYPGRQVYCTVFPTEKSKAFLCSSFSSANCNLVGAPQAPIERIKRCESQAGQARRGQAHKELC